MVDTVTYCMSCYKLIGDQAPRWLLFLPRRLDFFSILYLLVLSGISRNNGRIYARAQRNWAQQLRALLLENIQFDVGKDGSRAQCYWEALGKLFGSRRISLFTVHTIYIHTPVFAWNVRTLERYVGAKLAMCIQDCPVIAMCSVQGGCSVVQLCDRRMTMALPCQPAENY